MIVTVCILVALVLALIAQFQAKGRDLVAWAVVFLAIAALIGSGFSL